MMSYSTVGYLNTHRKDVHNKSLKCDHCDKMFGTTSRRDIHFKTEHGPKDQECSHCDMKFTTKRVCS